MSQVAESSGRDKSAAAFRTISEVAADLNLPQHVLRFWESRFVQVRPLKRGGGRRYYRPEDVQLLRAIRELLYDDGYTIKGVQKLLRGGGVRTEPEAPEVEAAGAPPGAGAPGAGAEAAPNAPAPNAPAPNAAAPDAAAALNPAQRADLDGMLDDLQTARALLARYR